MPRQRAVRTLSERGTNLRDVPQVMLNHVEAVRPKPRHKIKRQSLPETLAQSLQERILNGEFKEGDPLVQETLAEEYEVSRMPVREALRQLEASGLVVMQTHKGAIVTSIPTEQVGEMFELRALLECDVLGHAVPKMTDEDLGDTRAVLSQLEAAYRAGDVHKWGALNWEFHRSLYSPSGRVQTLGVIQGINVQTDRYIRLQLQLAGPNAVADAEKEHREILRLCEARETREAVAYLRRHVLNAGKHLVVALRNRTKAAAAT